MKNWLNKLFARKPNKGAATPGKNLLDWFTVRFDDVNVYREANPPGKEPWRDCFRWDEVIRVCYKAEGPFLSDGVYFFTSDRPEGYVIPTEAAGGDALMGEILRRKLFHPELLIKACASEEGLFCWPEAPGDLGNAP
ncbi:MAG: hypothetical protein HYU64_15125 [Armatimonadetes bacterium]|nr:hypothetical protein [Armatimonadota bacterium]